MQMVSSIGVISGSGQGVPNHEIQLDTDFAIILGSLEKNDSRDDWQNFRLSAVMFLDGKPAPKDFDNWIKVQAQVNAAKHQNDKPVMARICPKNFYWEIQIPV